MAIAYKGKKLGALAYKGKRISGIWYKGKKVYSSYVPEGTMLYDTGGYPTVFTSWYSHKGSVGVSEVQNIQSVSSNSIQLPIPVSRIKNGIQFTVENRGTISYDKAYFMIDWFGHTTYDSPIKVTVAQLKAGFTYATFLFDGVKSEMKVTLKDDALTFSSTATGSSGHTIGTAVSYDNSSALFLFIGSITAY